MKYKFVTLIVNWNGGNHVLNCLESLEKIDPTIPRVTIVVDNASTDGSDRQIESAYSDVLLIRNESNLGFAKANNIGLRYIREQKIEADYIFFLNNDTEYLTGSFDRLLAFLDDHPLVVSLTPAIIEGDYKFQTGVGGQAFTIPNILIYFLFLNKLPFWHGRGINLDQHHFFKKKKTVQLDWVSGAAFFVRSAILSDAPFFPENYFMYFEDVMMSKELKKKGIILFYPHMLIRHDRSYSQTGIDKYFNSFHRYLIESGYGPLKRFIIKKIIQLGLHLRLCIYRLIRNRNHPAYLAVKHQISSIRQVFH